MVLGARVTYTSLNNIELTRMIEECQNEMNNNTEKKHWPAGLRLIFNVYGNIWRGQATIWISRMRREPMKPALLPHLN